jgi:hypothetical protein
MSCYSYKFRLFTSYALTSFGMKLLKKGHSHIVTVNNLWSSYCPTIHNHLCSWDQFFVQLFTAAPLVTVVPYVFSWVLWTSLKLSWEFTNYSFSHWLIHWFADSLTNCTHYSFICCVVHWTELSSCKNLTAAVIIMSPSGKHLVSSWAISGLVSTEQLLEQSRHFKRRTQARRCSPPHSQPPQRYYCIFWFYHSKKMSINNF